MLSSNLLIEKGLVFVKDGKPTVATIEDVVNQTARRAPQGSAHGSILSEQGLISTKKGPDTFSPDTFSLKG